VPDRPPPATTISTGPGAAALAHSLLSGGELLHLEQQLFGRIAWIVVFHKEN